MKFLGQIVATVGGLGYAPVASGTVASAVAAAAWWLAPISASAQWVICGAVIVLGTWAADRWSKTAGREDPSEVVIDEVAGMWITLIALPKTWPVLIAGFLLFRLFDIGKFPPMKQLERLSGGWGIMLDDVAAGVISRVLLVAGLAFLG